MTRQSQIEADRALGDSLRQAILSRGCLALSFLVITFIAIFTPGGLYAWLNLPGRFAILLLALVLFLGWSYAFIPRIVRLGLRKGWPIVGLQIALYMPLVLLLTEAMHIAPAWGAKTPPLGMMFGAGAFLTAITCILGALLFQTMLAGRLDHPLTTQDLWTFRRTEAEALLDHMPNHIRAAPLRLQAENQYTRVWTSRGTDLLRMTLSEAEALSDPNRGMRIHRSHWVSFAAIAKIGSRGGNPQVELNTGEVVPVSRQKVGALRERLNRWRNA